MIFLLLSVGCTTLVRPPARPPQPTIVYLTDQTIHSSVLMPTETGIYVEYTTGDWAYAALDQHDLFHALRALLFSPQGALGRRYLKLQIHTAPMAPELKDITLIPIVVDDAKVKTLQASLAAEFETGKFRVENPENHFIFTKVDPGYGLFNNCNTLSKRSLREMDCQVVSRSPFAMYEVCRGDRR